MIYLDEGKDEIVDFIGTKDGVVGDGEEGGQGFVYNFVCIVRRGSRTTKTSYKQLINI